MMKLPKGLIYFSRMILHTESIGNNNYYKETIDTNVAYRFL